MLWLLGSLRLGRDGHARVLTAITAQTAIDLHAPKHSWERLTSSGTNAVYFASAMRGLPIPTAFTA
jgi:hypothetical protein